jgi:hypothetical protein
MQQGKSRFLFGALMTGLVLLCLPLLAVAQEEPSACVVQGALAYDSWITEDAGGSGLPDGETDNDYLRCKSCHGWDQLGTDGGYVRRSRNAGRPNAGAGDVDQASRDISYTTREGTPVTAEMIFQAGRGRSLEDGSGSWVALEDPASPANKAAYAAGYTLGNQHPDFSTGGANALTQEQADCIAEFLNYEDAGWDAYFEEINPNTDPVLYTIRSDADADRGETFYSDVCFACHGDPAEVGNPFPIEGDEGILEFLADTPHFSEFYQKVRWGHPDSAMTRAVMGNPTALDVADVMLYLQDLGGTGFALNPGLTGTWWGGAERDGEGFLLEFGYSNEVLTLFASFYTFDSMGNQAWLVALPIGGALPESGTEVPVDFYMVTGPMWGEDFDPADRAAMLWGTGTFSFSSCTSGSVTLSPGDDAQGMGYTELTYALQRDLLISGNACPTPMAN